MPLQTVVETPEFLRRASAVGLSEVDREDVVDQLATDPEAGVSLGSGLWKVRIARKGKGKSSGYRVLYFFRAPDLPIFLLTVFAKMIRRTFHARKKQNLPNSVILSPKPLEPENE